MVGEGAAGIGWKAGLDSAHMPRLWVNTPCTGIHPFPYASPSPSIPFPLFVPTHGPSPSFLLYLPFFLPLFPSLLSSPSVLNYNFFPYVALSVSPSPLYTFLSFLFFYCSIPPPFPFLLFCFSPVIVFPSHSTFFFGSYLLSPPSQLSFF